MLNLLKNLFGASSTKLKELIDDGAVIVDVRTPAEFKSGHLNGSKNIPLDILPQKIAELKKLNKTIITVCRSGARSSAAKDILTRAGLEVCNGGAWTSLKSVV